MAEKEKKSSGQAKTWFEGLRSEFKKIIWPDQKTLVKQTVAVVAITAVLGVLISVFDAAILEGINLLVK
ncbi:MAG: preprotein translocase subunit SecE [Lachnospiraceae bacterium]|jgi:preprotein translocase subunit SecE|nr:preprotein translocase subunit SecE [Lachnospiraceae bacterium]MCI9389647.1 preprotein translocase subunit SecE [Lachnospiraceae bacterium]MCI9470344.1 preprotein translocase subunit SecE [Lachnospiraceae bacterium]